MCLVLIYTFCFLFPAKRRSQANQAKTVLTYCNVIDCTGSNPMKNMTVVVTGNIISEITSVRSVGERDYIDVAWRDAFDAGFFVGPRIFASGESVAPTAGHRGDVAHGADGVAEIRKAIRTRAHKGVDLIKIVDVEMLQDELETAIETTHSLGMHITAHSREPATYRSVMVGVDCIEHGYGLSDESIKLMAEKGAFYDPTIICNLSEEYIKERENRLKKLGYAEGKEILYYRTVKSSHNLDTKESLE